VLIRDKGTLEAEQKVGAATQELHSSRLSPGGAQPQRRGRGRTHRRAAAVFEYAGAMGAPATSFLRVNSSSRRWLFGV